MSSPSRKSNRSRSLRPLRRMTGPTPLEDRVTAAAGIDTVSFCWTSPGIARSLVMAFEACRTLGEAASPLKMRGSLISTDRSTRVVPVRRGKSGSVVAVIDDVAVIAYPASGLVSIEGRLHNILGRPDNKHALTGWDDLQYAPAAIDDLLTRLALISHDAGAAASDPTDLDDLRPVAPRLAELQVRRIDLACDLRFPPEWKRVPGVILEHASRTILPRHLITTYREGSTGTLSLAISRTGTRAIQARAYDRSISTGDPIGRTIRFESQHRWSAERRRTLEELRATFQPETEWRARIDHWIPISPIATGIWNWGGAHAIIAAWRSGLITNVEAEHALGAVTALEHGVELWSADGWRRRKSVLAKLGAMPVKIDPDVEPQAPVLDARQIRRAIGRAWGRAAL